MAGSADHRAPAALRLRPLSLMFVLQFYSTYAGLDLRFDWNVDWRISRWNRVALHR